MRLILSIGFVIMALLQGNTVPAQEKNAIEKLLQQEKDKDKDKKPEPGVKEINEIAGKTVEQWIKELRNADSSRAEVAMQTIPLFPFAKAHLALKEMMDELDLPVGKLDANSRLGLISAVSTIIGGNADKVNALEMKRALAIFTKSLRDSQVMVRMRAMGALATIGPDAQSAVKDLLVDLRLPIDLEVRVAAINSIGMIFARTQKRDPVLLAEALLVLGIQTDHTQLVVRINALKALGYIGPDANSTVPKIILQLQEKKGSWEVRQMAASALGTVGFDAMFQNANSKIAQEALIASLSFTKEPCSQVRLAAIQSIELHGVPHVVEQPDPKKTKVLAPKPFLEKAPVILALDAVAFKDPEPTIQIAATLAVMKLTRSVPKKNLDHLIKMMKDEDAGIRGQAVQSIGRIGEKAKDAVPFLMDMLYDKAQPVTLLSIWALSRMGKEGAPHGAKIALPSLLKYMADKDAPEVLKKAAKEAIDIIEGRTKEKDKKDTKDTKEPAK